MSYRKDSSLVLPSWKVTSHSSMQSSSDSSQTTIIIDGSELTYTPHPDANNVVYEISYSTRRINDRTFPTFILQHEINNVWSNVGSKYIYALGNSGTYSQAYRTFDHVRFVLPTWTGSRSYRLAVGAYSTGRRVDFHQLDSWDGASASTIFTNTTLVMHSLL